MTAALSPERWSAAAPFYDWQLVLERPALRAIVAMVDLGESDRLLDVATGTAALPRELEALAIRPRRLVGVDSSEGMLERARSVLADRIELVRADARSLPFTDASFEVVTCAYLLHLLTADERDEVLGELRRVLVAGGRLGLVTVAPPRGPLGRLIGAPLRAAARRSSGALAGMRPLDPAEDLHRAGFEPTGVRRVRRGYASLCVAAVRGG